MRARSCERLSLHSPLQERAQPNEMDNAAAFDREGVEREKRRLDVGRGLLGVDDGDAFRQADQQAHRLGDRLPLTDGRPPSRTMRDSTAGGPASASAPMDAEPKPATATTNNARPTRHLLRARQCGVAAATSMTGT